MGPIPFISSIKLPPRQENDNINESYRPSCMLVAPTLEDLKNVLYVALNPYFEEFEIAVVSCPCLNKAPYNLAAAGLSGNTGIFKLGTFDNFYPSPLTNNKAYNIRAILSRCNNDVFVIGSGFATQPSMFYDGHLIMNAVVSTKDRNIINNSCIAYHHTRLGQKRFEIINDPNKIKCSLFGQFFFSEGKRGPVIKIRVKGRRSRSSIIALIQKALTNLCQKNPIIGLGIVLVVNGGRTILQFVPDDFVISRYNEQIDYFNKLITCSGKCNNLIALGALFSQELSIYENKNKNAFLLNDTSMFNTFPKYMGSFFNDLTPEETEYIVYINIAQEICL
ncbi:hypothetical protein ACFW04_005124 [Cataglyphis niger]